MTIPYDSWNSWQQAFGTKSNLHGNQAFLEAFGADVGNVAGGSMSVRGAEAMATDEEIPRVFSMKEAAFQGGATALRGGRGIDSWGQQHVLQAGRTRHHALVREGLDSPGLLGDSRWVTVFGFPGRMALAVRQQLESLCGPIAEVCHGDGNFMHVRFHNPQAASSCLTLNGQLLLGKLMVGCIPCAHSALLAASNGEREAQETDRYPGGVGGIAGPGIPPAAMGPGGPQVRRGALLWRVLDYLFDM
eukprot:TRINITY_DN58595_c0_g1_i1.p1 TRINITY_DN58595_c0_g1~~TRINITY_DN58595_c0_g1_i1.p1  ORF type:complete len:246 (+),score=30.20 TRINITY_DN58595_c0_g1_i1:48-785(+)